jgi:hypothetical protein
MEWKKFQKIFTIFSLKNHTQWMKKSVEGAKIGRDASICPWKLKIFIKICSCPKWYLKNTWRIQKCHNTMVFTTKNHITKLNSYILNMGSDQKKQSETLSPMVTQCLEPIPRILVVIWCNFYCYNHIVLYDA